MSYFDRDAWNRKARADKRQAWLSGLAWGLLLSAMVDVALALCGVR